MLKVATHDNDIVLYDGLVVAMAVDGDALRLSQALHLLRLFPCPISPRRAAWATGHMGCSKSR
jgi:hypothetical protein